MFYKMLAAHTDTDYAVSVKAKMTKGDKSQAEGCNQNDGPP